MQKPQGLKFIDFCSGIGGGRLGLEQTGMKCVGFSEIDKIVEKTYRHFFNNEREANYGNVMKIDPLLLPDFDVMIAGFPCQPFSVLGGRGGMEDSRGQIIYGLIAVLKAKKVKYFILENVKGLLSHKNGLSMKIILDKLDEAGYRVFWKLVNSVDYGVPHMRERIYFVGIRKDLANDDSIFEFPTRIQSRELSQHLIDDSEDGLFERSKAYATFLRYLENKYNKGKIDVRKLLQEEFLVIDTRQSDVRLYRGKVPTLRTGRHGILYVRDNALRKLSGDEALSLQGFPKNVRDKVKYRVSDVHLLSQAGNAMTVNVVQGIGQSLLGFIQK